VIFLQIIENRFLDDLILISTFLRVLM